MSQLALFNPQTEDPSEIESLRQLNSNEREPQTPEELQWKIWTDEKYFLETCCKIVDIHTGEMEHFFFKTAQEHFYHTYWIPHYEKIIMCKSRKCCLSTLIMGLGAHAAMFQMGIKFRIVAHIAKTAAELNETVKLIYDQAEKFLIEMGEDPNYYLPKKKYDNLKRYTFPERNSAIIVETAGGIGIGQSDRTDILYLTEYSMYTDAEGAYKGLTGSMPVGGINNRIIIDFNADGIGNDACRKYHDAKRGVNGFIPCFYGVKQNPDIYSKEKLKEKELELKEDYPAVYPSNDEEAFLMSPSQRFNSKKVLECGEYNHATGEFEAQYLCDLDKYKTNSSLLLDEIFSHGCDPAEGIETGSKTAIATRHVKSGMLACPPFNDFLSPRETAFELRRRFEKMPGIIIIESNNHGHAVIQKCEDLVVREGPFAGRPLPDFLYRHPDEKKSEDEWKLGWPETKDNKALMESEYEERLSELQITMPCEELRTQAREYCKRDNQTTGRPLRGERRGGKRISYDDLVIADMIAIQGFPQAMELMTAKDYPVSTMISEREEVYID